MVAVGICDLHVTVGEAETDRFQKQQDENRLLKRKFFDKLDVDLSEPLAPEIEEPSIEAMTQRKMDDFMAGAWAVYACHGFSVCLALVLTLIA
jgi:hypothetical protein